MNCGKVEEPSSSRSQYPSTARFAATSAILTVILSRSDRAPSSSTVSARPGWDSDLNGCGCSLEALRLQCRASTLVLIDTFVQRDTRTINCAARRAFRFPQRWHQQLPKIGAESPRSLALSLRGL